MNRFLVITPYYRTIPNVSTNMCTEEADVNYTPYDLFCLTTKLSLYLIQIKRTYQPTLISTELNQRMVFTVQVLDGDTPVELTDAERTKLQDVVNKAMESPRTCPLFSIYGYSKFPKVWLSMILPYLTLPPTVNPYIEEGTIYIELDSKTDYMGTYNTLTRSLHDQIENYYKLGVITCDQTFAQQWSLIPLYTQGSLPKSGTTLLNVPYISIPPQTDSAWYATQDPGYGNVLNDWDSTFSTSKAGSGSRRETERTVAEIGQFFSTINLHGAPNPQQSIDTGLQLNIFVEPETPPITEEEIVDFNILEGTWNVTGSEALTDLEIDRNIQLEDANDEAVDDNNYGLYIPNWQDQRFVSNMVDFLLQRMHGEKSISLPAPNYPIRHGIALALYPYRPLFISDKIMIPAKNLQSTQRLVSRIYPEIQKASGYIIPLASSADDTFEDFKEYAKSLYPESSCVLYRVIDPQRPFVFSCKVPPEVNFELATQKLREFLDLKQKAY